MSKLSSGACIGLDIELASPGATSLGLRECCVLSPEAGVDVTGLLSLAFTLEYDSLLLDSK